VKVIRRTIYLAATPLLLAITLGAPGFAQDSHYAPIGQQIPPPTCFTIRGPHDGGYVPCTPSSHKEWLADITHWRMERRIRIGIDTARYEMPALKWAQSAFMQPQMMVHDRYFYDPVAGKYTVDRYLDDLDRRYGGIDAVLIWATYPNMGIDDRNQHDMVRVQHSHGRRVPFIAAADQHATYFLGHRVGTLLDVKDIAEHRILRIETANLSVVDQSGIQQHRLVRSLERGRSRGLNRSGLTAGEE